MPSTSVTRAKKGGRVNKITRVHEERDVVRVEREGGEPGSEPVAEVVQQKKNYATVNLSKGKTRKAALRAPGPSTQDEFPEEANVSTQEAEDILSEAEDLLNEPIQGDKGQTTAAHREAPTDSDDIVPETQHSIEEVPSATAHDDHDDPHVEEPDSSASAKPRGILPKVAGFLTSFVHPDHADDVPTAEGTSSKAQDEAQAEKVKAGAAKGGSKKAPAVAPATPPKKGKAAAKRAADPVAEAQAPPKKAQKNAAKPTTATDTLLAAAQPPATPIQKPAGQEVDAKPSSTKGSKSTKSGQRKGAKAKKRSVETYRTYIYKVLKEVHPDVGISKQAMQVMNAFAGDMFDKIMKEATKLTQVSKKATLSSREIQTAVRLLMPGELAKHAIQEGTKAVTKATT